MAPEPAASYRLGLVLVLLSTISWSTTGLFTRLIALDGWTMLFWRGIFGGLGLLAVIWLLEGRHGLTRFRRLGRPGLAYVLIAGIGMAAYLTSIVHTTVAHVAVIYAAAPFAAAGLGWLVLRQKPTASAMLAATAALGGVALMVGFGTEGRLLGDAIAVLMTLCMAAMMVLARRYPEIPTLQAACLSAFLTSALVAPFGAPLVVTGTELSILLVFGLVSNAAGLGLFILGARRLPPVETALVSALEAPIAPLWVWAAFAETPSPATLAGGAVVMAAVVWHILREARRVRPAGVAVPPA